MNQENETIQSMGDTKWLAGVMGIAVDTIEKNRCYFPELLPPHYVIFGRTIRYVKAEVYEWIKARQERR